MRIDRLIITVILLNCLGVYNVFAQKDNVWNPDNGNGTFTNPIFGEIGRIRILFVWMISFILFLQVCIMSQVVQSLFLRI